MKFLLHLFLLVIVTFIDIDIINLYNFQVKLDMNSVSAL